MSEIRNLINITDFTVEEIDRAEDTGERGLDLVGEVGDELAPEPFGPLEFGELAFAFADARA